MVWKTESSLYRQTLQTPTRRLGHLRRLWLRRYTHLMLSNFRSTSVSKVTLIKLNMSKVTERPSNGLMIINGNDRCLCHMAQTDGNTTNHHIFTFGNRAFVSSSQKNDGWKVTLELICFSTLTPYSRKTTSNTYTTMKCFAHTQKRTQTNTHTHTNTNTHGMGPFIVQWLIIRVSVKCVLADLWLDSNFPLFSQLC